MFCVVLFRACTFPCHVLVISNVILTIRDLIIWIIISYIGCHTYLIWLPMLKSMGSAWDIPNVTFEWFKHSNELKSNVSPPASFVRTIRFLTISESKISAKQNLRVQIRMWEWGGGGGGGRQKNPKIITGE